MARDTKIASESAGSQEHASVVLSAQRDLVQKTQLLSLSREALIILDTEGRIVSWNLAAERLYGWPEREVLSKSAVEVLKTELPRTLPQIENILRYAGYWDYELKQTTRDGRQVVVASRWALWRGEDGQVLGRFQLDTDVTKRKSAEQQLRVISGRLLNLRDEERRRIARDLHDSVGQLLSLTKVNLSMGQKHLAGLEASAAALFTESCDLIDQALAEVRTISYLLHPPLLEELGLASVLDWYVGGFSERSQIKVDLEVSENLGRFSHELETAVFRIIQECLTNVHRHSGSATAKISLARSKTQLRLKIEDQGKGMKTEGKRVIPGVGLNGIRERVGHLGGQMQVRTGGWGTAMEVIFPLDGFAAPQPAGEASKSAAS
jgi:two-component system, NarL family, sensor kinase